MQTYPLIGYACFAWHHEYNKKLTYLLPKAESAGEGEPTG